MDPIVELYSPERLARLERRRKRVKLALILLAAAALAVCVGLTCRANTRNLYDMLLACVCVSVGAAWIIIYFGIYWVRNAGRELDFARRLTEGPRESVTGRVTVLNLIVRIRNSVTIRKVRVETADGPVELNLQLDRTEPLRRAGARLTLYVVHGYIAAWQRTEEEADRADT